ncbi:alkylglycerol monooxygenase-like [Penaeus japonicus]|uniref:alkylglycerol monooxygenase-like n=1 Tax=Penaeus japonicus TaxID=27405 RepID=UPI001C70FA82|nr:alkylglycerol monooxygenase-like [Penaeus japonicus]
MSTLVEQVGSFFYIINPNTTTFEHEEDIPNYINDAIPVFVAFLILEVLVGLAKGKATARFNDGITSLGHGIVYETFKLVTRGFELWGYSWLYEHRLLDLNWSSPVTWWLAAIGVDFAYYWTHRATHEVNFIWAAHQVHHSSEDYNLNTAIRQSMFQRVFALGFHQPLALLGVPLPATIVHMQFNLLFQFWIHTELVDNCGPIEWIFNTPSHHRVHHGANKWCLDKNYAGVLIIWDRIFGTFEKERKDEEIVYGLVDQPQSFNVMWLQFFYFGEVFKKAKGMSSWSDSLKAVFYGPGWFPGTPRLGDPDAFPDVKAPRRKYDPQMPLLEKLYVTTHFVIVLLIQQVLTVKLATFNWLTVLMFIIFILVSIGNIGAMYDGWWWAPLLEAARCVAYIAYARDTPVMDHALMDAALLIYFAASTLVWTSRSLGVVRAAIKTAKLE